MAKVLHAADFHLDSAFRALPEEQARLRRQESRELPGRLVDWANDHGARLMLLAGDLFDSDQLYSQTAQMLAQALSRFRGTVVIAPGNHDWLSAASPYRQPIWPENVHIFLGRGMERLALPELQCTVYGAAFTAPEEPESGLRGFYAQPLPPPDPGGDRLHGPGLSGPGPCPRPLGHESGREHRVGLSRLSPGPGL